MSAVSRVIGAEWNEPLSLSDTHAFQREGSSVAHGAPKGTR